MKKIRFVVVKIILVFLFLPVFINTGYCQTNSDGHILLINSLDWSPDGQRLLFTALKVKSDYSDMAIGNWGLYEMNLEDHSISLIDNGILYASYSPSGDRIAYGKLVANNWDIYVRTISTGKTTRLTTYSGKDNEPSWSPDGTRIAFDSDRGGGRQIFIMDADGKNKREITHSDNAHIKSFNPAWSLNDDRILYFLEKGDHMDQIYLTDSEGSFHNNLTNNKEHNIYPSWTRDNVILYTMASKENQVYRLTTEGKLMPVKGLKGMHPKMSPDVKTIAIIGNDTGKSKAIFFFSTDGKSLKKVVDKDALTTK